MNLIFKVKIFVWTWVQIILQFFCLSSAILWIQFLYRDIHFQNIGIDDLHCQANLEVYGQRYKITPEAGKK